MGHDHVLANAWHGAGRLDGGQDRAGVRGRCSVFAAELAIVGGLYFATRVSHTLLFWAAFILTRPLGATVGDFLDKPIANGGLALARFAASAVLAALILGCIFLVPQRPERHPGEAKMF